MKYTLNVILIREAGEPMVELPDDAKIVGIKQRVVQIPIGKGEVQVEDLRFLYYLLPVAEARKVG